MKTILDKYDELYLESLYEQDDLTCILFPMKLEKHHRKVPDKEGVQYEVKFHNVEDYFVLQELTHAALELSFLDDGHLTESNFSKLSKILRIQDIFPDNDTKHYVLRTAHCAVHVFTASIPIVLKSDG